MGLDSTPLCIRLQVVWRLCGGCWWWVGFGSFKMVQMRKMKALHPLEQSLWQTDRIVLYVFLFVLFRHNFGMRKPVRHLYSTSQHLWTGWQSQRSLLVRTLRGCNPCLHHISVINFSKKWRGGGAQKDNLNRENNDKPLDCVFFP